MNSIQVLRREIYSQVSKLQSLELAGSRPSGVMIGSGDSYAACMLASQLCGWKTGYFLPTEVLANKATFFRQPYWRKNMPVYIVSVSGRTSANLKVTHVLKSLGYKTIAITRDKSSPLARVCNEIIEVKLEVPIRAAAGTLSFTALVLICCSILGSLKCPSSVGMLFRDAERLAKRLVNHLASSDKSISSFLFLGESIMYPVGVYGAMKINEVLGYKAIAYNPNEFCHSPVFGLKRSDLVLSLERASATKKLRRQLNTYLLRPVAMVNCNENSQIEAALKGIFFVQLLCLFLAERRGLTDCYFLSNNELLKISSSLIY